MRRIGGMVLTVAGILFCPCHLIITLPLLLSGLSGTALGSFLSRNTSLIYTGAAIYFVGALAVGVFFLFGRTGSGTLEKTTCSGLSSLRTRIYLNKGDNTDVNSGVL